MSSPNDFLPPMIDGVSASQVYLPQQKDTQTIYEYLCGHFAHIRTDEWKQRFQDGLIYGANGQKLTLDSPYQSNSHIFYYRFLAYEPLYLLSITFYLKMMIYWWSINHIF